MAATAVVAPPCGDPEGVCHDRRHRRRCAHQERDHRRPAEPTHEHHVLVGKEATKETLEDYTLRFAPAHYRRWTPGVVAISALGGIAYLADFAIGANIGIAYGTTNALWGIADLRGGHLPDRRSRWPTTPPATTSTST